jgi:bifunctional NMN adenylyltransferase/nudix hydrolase
MRYDYLIFIGRFQPFHIGHEQIIKKALSISDKVIVLIGSAYQPRTVRNNWEFNEREKMLRCNFTQAQNTKILTFPLLDYIYNDVLWIKSIQQLIVGVVHNKIASSAKIGLIGHQKDETSAYLNQFQEWEKDEMANYQNISSTDIREAYFNEEEISDKVSVSVAIELEKFKQADFYQEIVYEFCFIQKYKQAWDNAPYAPMFITVDAVVVQSGHILLIKRKAQPGRGLMALPGGFLDTQETLKNAVIRELRE